MEDIRTRSIELLKDLFSAEYFLPEEGVEETFENIYKECTEGIKSWIAKGYDSEAIPLECLKYLDTNPDLVAKITKQYI